MVKATEAQFIAAVVSEISIAAVLRSLGMAVSGGSYQSVKREVARLKLDTGHWKGRSHGTTRVAIGWDKVLVENSPHRITDRRKSKLISEGHIRDWCYQCFLSGYWQGKPLVFQIDHINGKSRDNRIENLRLLCPNCHSQTSTYRGKQNKKPVG